MPNTKLLDQVRDIAQVKHMSCRTAKACVYWIKRFILFHNKRHPCNLGTEEISAFLSQGGSAKGFRAPGRGHTAATGLALEKAILVHLDWYTILPFKAAHQSRLG